MDKQSVTEVIESQIRPGLEAHGGGIDLIDVKDSKVYVRLTGACGGCPMAAQTLKMGVEQALRDAFPDLQEVISV